MFLIPGFLIALITFPGVIVHEIAHRFFCDLMKVPVYDVCYIRVGNPAGYVVHGPVEKLSSAFLISVGPFIVNTLLCSLIAVSSVVPTYVLGDSVTNSGWHMFLMYIAISIGMHAFPSKEDLNNFHEQVKRAKGFSPLLIFSHIVGAIFFVARLLSFVWFDLIYAFLVATILPLLILGI